MEYFSAIAYVFLRAIGLATLVAALGCVLAVVGLSMALRARVDSLEVLVYFVQVIAPFLLTTAFLAFHFQALFARMSMPGDRVRMFFGIAAFVVAFVVGLITVPRSNP